MTLQSSEFLSPTTVVLMPIFIAKPGRGADLERVLMSLQAASRADNGCLDYSVYADVNDENKFVMHEEWTDQEVLNAHNLTAHVTDFVAQTADLLSEPFTVTHMRAIGE
jgi:quinol monooxygenase YgiN